MTIQAKYVHTNLIAQDWRPLADFYEEVFGCVPGPSRDIGVAAGTAIPNARVRGADLRLPGYAFDGPNLEIFEYNIREDRAAAAPNRPGFGHIAFSVPDIVAAQKEVLQAGGRAVGEIVWWKYDTGEMGAWCYVTDPEGNIIELTKLK